MGNLTAKMPQNVKTSLILFGISIVLGIISHQFLSKSLDAYVAEIQQQYAQGVPQNSAATEGGKIGGYIGFLLNIFLLYMVYKGKNWARIVILVLGVLGIFVIIFSVLPILMRIDKVLLFFYAISCLLQIIALILLFTPSARPWFVKPKEEEGV
ncbi:hypothetical protein [Ornithobacterium rhinotracheale]|uniref:DUF4064 domain-containing protein n=1 Tax=Ornithobacterium rhinotracheale (strain ATCC 51463 / DSM 15997 / CCUG 23171 / CIP 104009 / LMG 9086) TaxID=867902 RepID=I3ZXU7_ORNRL|nr:hypothetical protein [Ornithobacterium rhinotracheale]AFL96531.1 hypothetical protein Ornrh_0313 [Ornithobacterium rhinotracheale DSM 15997]AIQ00292.1 hypothetical protein Q785_01700 [Ornithobacterium rhinotracheale ORT-UMN 88]KGB67854.1 hypothetical protein Q787_01670 [Ornithobacterium rhinotracheale H06-030791]MCK0194856.1 hypothetical protein [Ornithobacterium rhinotracheale]MCK0200678.1 hypothetical protein [Ornithobacterium rhinotracheale]